MTTSPDYTSYTLSVENTFPSDVTGVTITDILPPGFTYSTSTAAVITLNGATRTSTSDPSDGDTQPTWGEFTIPSGVTMTITFTALIDDSVAEGIYDNDVTAESPDANTIPFDPLLTTDDDVEVIVLGPPVIEAEKVATITNDTAPIGEFSPGDTVTYTIDITNTGEQPATNVVFTDTPDANSSLTATSVTTTQGAVTLGNTAGDTGVAVDIGTIAVSGTVTITFDVVIDDPLATGVTEIANQGIVSSDELPDEPTDFPDTLTDDDPTIIPVTSDPIIEAEKTDTLLTDNDGDSVPSPGDVLQYYVRITNIGNTDATTVAFTDNLSDANIDLVVGSVSTSQGIVIIGNTGGDTSIVIAVGTVVPTDVIDIYYEVTIADPLGGGATEVQNQGEVTADGPITEPTDDPETGIGGVTVDLVDENGVVVKTVTTSGDGSYLFTGVVPGSYTVRETDPNGFISTTNNGVAVSMTSGGADTANFGDQQVGILSGTVFNDINGNGVQDKTEHGIGGVTIDIIDAGGNVVQSLTTASDGTYLAGGIAVGEYTVRETDPGGYVSTTDNEVSVNMTPDAPAVANFGDNRIGAVTGSVFNDTNGNGIQDPGENGIGGVTVELVDENGNVVETETTSGDGSYGFIDVTAGDYTVREVDPDGYISTSPNEVELTVDAGSSNTANFGDQQTGVVSGVVFNDINGDGIRNPGENGINGVVVQLIDDEGNVVQTVTDENGNYGFTGVSTGSYTIVEIDPAGFISSTENTILADIAPGGSATGNFGDQKVGTISGVVFNDVNGDGIQNVNEHGIGGVQVILVDDEGNIVQKLTAGDGSYIFTNVTPGSYTVEEMDPEGFASTTNNTVPIYLPSGGSASVNFGDQKVAVISGIVFHDTNGNLIQDITEPGIGGVLIELMDMNGNVVASTITSGNGTYIFVDVPVGEYIIRETDPNGYSSTTLNEASAIMVTGGYVTANFGDWIPEVTTGLDAVKSAFDADGQYIDTVQPGDTVHYEIVVTNTGNADAENLVLSDDPPAFTTLIPGTLFSTKGTIVEGDPLTVDIGDLAPGDTVVVSFQVTLDQDIISGVSIVNQAVIKGDNVEKQTDNPGTATPGDPTGLIVIPLAQYYDPPSGAKTVSGDKPVIQWQMEWRNDDNMESVLVHIEDVIPDNMTYVSGSLQADYGVFEYDDTLKRIIWEGYIPGEGGILRIRFETVVRDDVYRVDNQACAIWDRNGNGEWTDEIESGVSTICTDDPTSIPYGDPTAWKDNIMVVGNRVWNDCNMDGVYSPDEETGINGVIVNLYMDDDNNGYFSEGDILTGSVATVSTPDGDGFYRFESLAEGEYIIRIDPANFRSGGVLEGRLSGLPADETVLNSTHSYLHHPPIEGKGFGPFPRPIPVFCVSNLRAALSELRSGRFQ